MEYFNEFHWWYAVVGFLFLFIIFGKGKGGMVVKRYTAKMDILDPRFEGCRPEAMYTIFKEGSPDHIEIEVERLSLDPGEEMEFYLNGNLLAKVLVEKDREAEFDHWSDEAVDFPFIREGDELIVKYHNVDVLQGVFR